MVFILTHPKAAIPLKIMSPEFIVLSLLPFADFKTKESFKRWTKTMTSFCIGPGLGRDLAFVEQFGFVLDCLKGKVIIGDADFFWFLRQDFSLYKEKLKNLKKIILTPNNGEFKRLYKTAIGKDIDVDVLYSKVKELVNEEEEICQIKIFESFPEIKTFYKSFENDNIYFLLKGSYDIILGKKKCYVVKNKAALKRCGGQGDILSGLSCLFSFWAVQKEIEVEIALVFSSYLLRQCSFKAFKRKKLGMMTTDIIEELTEGINEFIEDESPFNDDSIEDFRRIN